MNISEYLRFKNFSSVKIFNMIPLERQDATVSLPTPYYLKEESCVSFNYDNVRYGGLSYKLNLSNSRYISVTLVPATSYRELSLSGDEVHAIVMKGPCLQLTAITTTTTTTKGSFVYVPCIPMLSFDSDSLEIRFVASLVFEQAKTAPEFDGWVSIDINVNAVSPGDPSLTFLFYDFTLAHGESHQRQLLESQQYILKSYIDQMSSYALIQS